MNKMNKEKSFLNNKRDLAEKRIEELQVELKEAQDTVELIDRKISEEDIIERILVTDVKVVETNTMRFNESEGIIAQGYGVLETPRTRDFVFRFLRKGSKVICTIYDHTGEVEVGRGVSKCHYKDEFNYQKGINIAELRAMQDKLKREEVKYY